ncbi:SAE2 domain-containing protein [Mycena indigotica]|uniref:SAE2 domain-containing protein n=1 Tax=Mycena indigotica TaxID=2126181 RepID=A0A8H6SVX8_9AGAR|nr:SAE2 domain-containing protein [Mycena indigotica]KAF7306441.1 SAE2 domain-containing protein [Mycena indigotica]
MPPTAYSGAELRLRDKAISDKYGKEKSVQEAKYQRLRQGYDALSNEKFELGVMGDNVATRLGFRSFAEMCSLIDLSDDHVSYKEATERVDELEGRLAQAEDNAEAFKLERDDALDERDSLHKLLTEAREQAARVEALINERDELRQEIIDVKQKAARSDQEWKDRFSQWKSFKAFMQKEELEYRAKVKGLEAARRDMERIELCVRRRERYNELELDTEVNEEPAQPSQMATTCPPTVMKSSSPTIAPPSTNGFNSKAPSPATFSTRTPLTFVPVRSPNDRNEKSPSTSVQTAVASDVIDLSESQSQPVAVPLSSMMPSRPSSSQIKPYPMLPPPSPAPKAKSSAATKHRHSDVFIRPRNDDDEEEEERPRKTRRYSSPVRRPLNPNRRSTSRSPMKSGSRSGRENRDGRHLAARGSPSKKANANSSKQDTDYSAYKGRGRYAKTSGGDETINSSYAIDPTRNAGVNFQFAEVVRGKEDRRRLQAGDCESCRDYYEAIGPLPARLQAPLWRSPPSSPVNQTTHTCRHGYERDVNAHKQAISRHREEWVQGTTPPGYWDIAFPTTQEAENINERAKKMHQQKLDRVQKDNRYYKKR